MDLSYHAKNGGLEQHEIDELCDISKLCTFEGFEHKRVMLWEIGVGYKRAISSLEKQLERFRSVGGDPTWKNRAEAALSHKRRELQQVVTTITRIMRIQRRLHEIQPDIQARAFMWAAKEILPPETYVAIHELSAKWLTRGEVPEGIVKKNRGENILGHHLAEAISSVPDQTSSGAKAPPRQSQRG